MKLNSYPNTKSNSQLTLNKLPSQSNLLRPSYTLSGSKSSKQFLPSSPVNKNPVLISKPKEEYHSLSVKQQSQQFFGHNNRFSNFQHVDSNWGVRQLETLNRESVRQPEKVPLYETSKEADTPSIFRYASHLKIITDKKTSRTTVKSISSTSQPPERTTARVHTVETRPNKARNSLRQSPIDEEILQNMDTLNFVRSSTNKPIANPTFLSSRPLQGVKSLQTMDQLSDRYEDSKLPPKPFKCPDGSYYVPASLPRASSRDGKESQRKSMKPNFLQQRTETGSLLPTSIDMEIESTSMKVLPHNKKAPQSATTLKNPGLSYNRAISQEDRADAEEAVRNIRSSLGRVLSIPKISDNEKTGNKKPSVQSHRVQARVGTESSFDSSPCKGVQSQRNTFAGSTETASQFEAGKREENQPQTCRVGFLEIIRPERAKKALGKSAILSAGLAPFSKNPSSGKNKNFFNLKSSARNKKATSPKEKEKLENLAFQRLIDAYKDFMLRVNLSFNLVVKPQGGFSYYKYYLGKGNNDTLIRSLMKQRWWWSQSDSKDPEDINFIWTQLRQNKFIESLQPKRLTLNEPEMSPLGGRVDSKPSLLEDEDKRNSKRISAVLNRQKSIKSTSHRSQTESSFVEGETEKEIGRSLLNEDDSKLSMLFSEDEKTMMRKYSYPKPAPTSLQETSELTKNEEKSLVQVITEPNALRMCNHIENNFHLGNKKALLWNMRHYYDCIKDNVFDYLPLTFHIRTGTSDPEWRKFLGLYERNKKEAEEDESGADSVPKNIWIVKPGEETNRGRGINVCSELSEIKELISEQEVTARGTQRTYLIQQYLSRPLLYNKRKFDIRCYMMISCINGIFKGYWYQEGYVRTSSKEFNLKNLHNKQVHLTNDAVQKKFDDYGRHEFGNKISFQDFQKYLEFQHEGKKVNFYADIYPQLKTLATDSIKAVYCKVDPQKREHYFEVFGLDFMIDDGLRAWLIEINTNPDITTTSPILTKIIPAMVDNALRLTIDPMFPPFYWSVSKRGLIPENMLQNNKFEIVFDEKEHGPALKAILQVENIGNTMEHIFEMDEEEEEESDEDP